MSPEVAPERIDHQWYLRTEAGSPGIQLSPSCPVPIRNEGSALNGRPSLVALDGAYCHPERAVAYSFVYAYTACMVMSVRNPTCCVDTPSPKSPYARCPSPAAISPSISAWRR